jgi:RsmE family RNA methyltransferase
MNLIILYPEDFTSHNRVVLKNRRLEYIRSVHKVSVGKTLNVGMIQGKMGIGTVLCLDTTVCELEVVLTKEPPAPLPCTLVLALPRPKALKRILEYVAAMGVKKVIILETWRVEKSFWNSPVLLEDCIREHCILGLEQGVDTIMPEIVIKKRFKPFVEDDLPAICYGTSCLVAHPVAITPCPCSLNSPLTLVIGPEGGFIPFEIDLLAQKGFLPVTFGQRILRVENAVCSLLGRLFS